MSINFKELGKQAQSKEKNRQEERRSGGGGFTPGESIHWTGFTEAGQGKIVRLLGGVPTVDSEYARDSATAKIVRVAQIYSDNKKKRFFYFPNEGEYILQDVMDIVLDGEWVGTGKFREDGSEIKEKVYTHADRYPNLVNRCLKNNFGTSGWSPNKFDKGWKPQEMIIMNVIDRERMDEHRQLQHSFLLSRHINIVEKEGKVNEYPDHGIPTYGFADLVLALIGSYGNPNDFDMYIQRATKTSPWQVKNASKVIEEIPEYLTEYIISTGLTDEERSWDTYNLTERFAPSGMLKIHNSFKNFFKEVDGAFSTHFGEKVETLAMEEKAEFDKLNAEKKVRGNVAGYSASNDESEDEENNPSSIEEELEVETPTPVVARQRRNPSEESISETLAYEGTITSELLTNRGFKGVAFLKSGHYDLMDGLDEDGHIKWRAEAGPAIGCVLFNDKNPDAEGSCNQKCPQFPDLDGCPSCGEKF